MSYRSIFILGDDAWPGLKFNPAKGDLEAIDNLASDVKAVSTELDQLDELLTSIGKNGGVWQGEAADRFSKKLGELPKYLKQGTDSMGDCAKALRSWHGQLSAFQRRAENLESEAVTARREADRLTDAYNTETDRLKVLGPMPADEADRLNKKLDRQRSEVDQAQDNWRSWSARPRTSTAGGTTGPRRPRRPSSRRRRTTRRISVCGTGSATA